MSLVAVNGKLFVELKSVADGRVSDDGTHVREILESSLELDVFVFGKKCSHNP